MMKMQIYRPHFSNYQDNHFKENERITISKINSKITYLTDINDINTNDPLILLTDTHVSVHKFPHKLQDQLKLIIHPNSGYDNFSPEWIKDINFPVVLGNTIRAQAVSEYILSCIFHRHISINHHPQWDYARIWDRPLIAQVKAAIIGQGHIGNLVAVALKGLNCNFCWHDPWQNLEINNWSDFDIIIFACSLNPSSVHFLNRNNIDELKSDVTIINAARGKLIEEDALLEFLKSNPSSFAYLDVREMEPNEKNYRQFIPNISTTSHIAGVFKDLNNKIVEFEKQVLIDFFNLTTKDFKSHYKKQLLNRRFRGNFLI